MLVMKLPLQRGTRQLAPGHDRNPAAQALFVEARPKSSNLRFEAQGNETSGSVTLAVPNVTGGADARLLLHSGRDNCGLEAWAAQGHPGPFAVAGRQPEPYDLGTPLSWKSKEVDFTCRCDG